jgi:hypothetical protein
MKNEYLALPEMAEAESLPCVGWERMQFSGGLEFQDNGGALGFEVDCGGAAVVIAENGGTKTQSKAGCFPVQLWGSVGVEGTIRLEETGAGMANQNLHQVSFACRLQTDCLSLGGSWG